MNDHVHCSATVRVSEICDRQEHDRRLRDTFKEIVIIFERFHDSDLFVANIHEAYARPQ